MGRGLACVMAMVSITLAIYLFVFILFFLFVVDMYRKKYCNTVVVACVWQVYYIADLDKEIETTTPYPQGHRIVLYI